MAKQFETLDEYPTLNENELAENTGGRDVCEGGGQGGPIIFYWRLGWG